MRIRIIVVLFAFAFSATLSVQERVPIGLTSETHHTPLSVLKKECGHVEWLSQALTDSRIEPFRMNNVPLDTKIYVDTTSCKLPAPPDVLRATEDLLGIKIRDRSATKPTPARRVSPRPRVSRPVLAAPPVDEEAFQELLNRNAELGDLLKGYEGKLTNAKGELEFNKLELAYVKARFSEFQKSQTRPVEPNKLTWWQKHWIAILVISSLSLLLLVLLVRLSMLERRRRRCR